MQRIFLDTSILWTDTIFIDDKSLINQFIKVLRSKKWDEFQFFNWIWNKDYIYKLANIEKKGILFQFINTIDIFWDISYKLNLFQAIPNKIDKIEYILKKWVEVWITSFTFFKSKRSQDLKLLSDSKLNRFYKIIIEAVEQSWRSIIPSLVFIDKEKLDINNDECNIFFHTNSKWSIWLPDIDFANNEINLFVWPEWWFDENEVNEFLELWFKHVYLGNRILRTETTWVVTWFYISQIKK